MAEEDQFQQLIEVVKVAAVQSHPTGVPDSSSLTLSKGNFYNCSARFGGDRDHECVNEFINSIQTYKEIEQISDEDALRGISLMFYGHAPKWWQGVKKEAKTWNDAIELIRSHFSPTKPPYQIYMEIFQSSQDECSAIDTFVSQKRALLGQLPEGRHDEENEIDLIYGLLHINYRKHIARHDIKTFRDLLEKGRFIEKIHLEDRRLEERSIVSVQRCYYCNLRGHITKNCRKKKLDGGT